MCIEFPIYFRAVEIGTVKNYSIDQSENFASRETEILFSYIFPSDGIFH